MAKSTAITKQALITKANSRMVIVTAVASFVVVFCGVASKTLITRASYQSRVITANNKTLSILNSDLSARTNLENAYQALVDTPQNLLGGNPEGSGPKDGNNAKIILDALPSEYDYPALASSITALAKSVNAPLSGFSGAALTPSQTGSQTNPTPIPITFQLSASGSISQIQTFINALEACIRPIQVLQESLSGSGGNLQVSLSVQTYYQPAKSLNISSEVVK